MICALDEPPQPTAWCNVQFVVLVTPPGVRVVVWLGWEGDLALESTTVGSDYANAAFRFVDDYRRRKVVAIHSLLKEARQKYEAEGPKDVLGTLPNATVKAFPVVEEGRLAVFLDVDGRPTQGQLNASLDWICDSQDPKVWSAAKYAALDFVLNARDALALEGFAIPVDEDKS